MAPQTIHKTPPSSMSGPGPQGIADASITSPVPDENSAGHISTSADNEVARLAAERINPIDPSMGVGCDMALRAPRRFG